MKKNNKIKIPKINMSYKFYSYDYNIIEENTCCDSKELKGFLEQLKNKQLNGTLCLYMLSDEKIVLSVEYKVKDGECEVIKYDNQL